MIVAHIKTGNAQTNMGKQLKAGDELYLNDTIIATKDVTISLNSNEDDLVLEKNSTMVLDRSVTETDIISEATIFEDQLASLDFFIDNSFELSQNDFFDFSNIEVVKISDEKLTVTIEDLIEDENNEIKIYSESAEQISINQDEWTKQDSQVTQDGRSFDVYSKNTDSGDIASLLIEDDISVFYNQG